MFKKYFIITGLLFIFTAQNIHCESRLLSSIVTTTALAGTYALVTNNHSFKKARYCIKSPAEIASYALEISYFEKTELNDSVTVAATNLDELLDKTASILHNLITSLAVHKEVIITPTIKLINGKNITLEQLSFSNKRSRRKFNSFHRKIINKLHGHLHIPHYAFSRVGDFALKTFIFLTSPLIFLGGAILGW